MDVTLLHAVSPLACWATIHRMVRVASHVFGVKAHAIPDVPRGRVARMLNRGAPRKAGGQRVLFAILTSGVNLINFRLTAEFRGGYDKVIVWIVDSFRTDHVSRWDSFAGIDLLVLSQDYDVPFYASRHSGDILVLPYGADVLSQPLAISERPYDVLRFGRQPDGWADDDATGARCAERGLRFHGRPAFSDDSDESHENVQRLLRDSRCALAFSNLVSTESYTHRTKPYFSTRWADALSCGAAVAGVPPTDDRAFGSLLWDGALVPMDTIDVAAGLDRIEAFCTGWTERTARTNQAMAMLRLDWRWRFKALCDHVGIRSSTLDAELAELEARAATLMSHHAEAS